MRPLPPASRPSHSSPCHQELKHKSLQGPSLSLPWPLFTHFPPGSTSSDQLQPHWLPNWPSNTPHMHLPQGLCTYPHSLCTHCLSAWNAIHSAICLACSLTLSSLSSGSPPQIGLPCPLSPVSNTSLGLPRLQKICHCKPTFSALSSPSVPPLPEIVSAHPAQGNTWDELNPSSQP